MPDESNPQNVLLQRLTPAILEALDRAGVGVWVSTSDRATSRHTYKNAAASWSLGSALAPSSHGLGPGASLRGWGTAEKLPRNTVEGEVMRSDGLQVRVAGARFRAAGEVREVHCAVAETARSLTERAVADAEAHFKEVLNAAPDLVLVIRGGSIIFANPVAARFSGTVPDGDLPSIPLAAALHPADVPILASTLARLEHPGQTALGQVYRMRRPDGHWSRIEASALVSEWEQDPAILLIGRELPDDADAQAHLIQADHLAAVGTLAAGVAHEINNPLAYVLLNLQYLLREMPKAMRGTACQDQLSERLQEARHGAERVGTIVRDLHDFSRADHDHLGPVDLRRVLGAAIKVAAIHFQNRAELVERYEAVPPATGNPARLEQVFLNLLINAIQALPRSRAPQNRVEVRLSQRGEDAVVEVEDNGVGIPPDLLDKVFDPFVTTKPSAIGTGLGLPICHSIVRSVGGSISVESELGRGTRFRVVLPLHPGQIAPRSLSPPPVAARLPRARVLVVDDELPVATMLSVVLESDHDVRVASSAQEALTLLLGPQEFDVVLCDLLMPEMSGMDLYREIARERPGLEQRIAFMTGGAFTQRAVEFLASVPNRRLEKPFTLKQVKLIVHELATQPSRAKD